MVIFLAGLQNISESLYEAAELDGAGALRKFRNITLPMLSPIILVHLRSRYYRLLPGLYSGLSNDARWPGQCHSVLRALPV